MIHIHLMSAQLIPNVIPTLSDITSVDKVYLVLAGNTFEKKANTLISFYQRHGIDEIEIYRCEDPNDYYSLRFKAKDLFKDIKAFFPNQFIMLNATGGTKPMSLAFTQEFDRPEEKSLAIYTDTIGKKIVVLNDGDNIKNLPYTSVLNITDYFELHDFQIDSMLTKDSNDDLIEDRSDLTKSIIDISSRFPEAISIINSLAQESNFNTPDFFAPTVSLRTYPKGDFDLLLSNAQSYGLIKYTPTEVTFNDIDAARYLGGGWFEELAYLAASDANIDQVALNVNGHLINDKETNVTNEFDVVTVNNNQIAIIESKTINWAKRESKGQDTTVKLDSLTHLYGGSFAEGKLLTVFPLTEKTQQRLNSTSTLTAYTVSSYNDLVTYFKDWKKHTER